MEMDFEGEKFKLFGIVDHIGRTIKFGHYVAYVLSGNDIWYRVS